MRYPWGTEEPPAPPVGAAFNTTQAGSTEYAPATFGPRQSASFSARLPRLWSEVRR
jgi:hypothetical protein